MVEAALAQADEQAARDRHRRSRRTPAEPSGWASIDYEALLAEGDPGLRGTWPADEWQAISAQLHLGHHRQPEGRRLPPPRRLPERASATSSPGRCRTFRSISGPCRCSTATAGAFPGPGGLQAGTHVCLRRVEPATRSSRLIAEHGVTHLCGAPIVMNMLVNAPERARRRLRPTVKMMTAGAAPPGGGDRGAWRRSASR